MAGNKVNTKTKSKEDKSKSAKGVNNINEDNEDPDFSLLRKPIYTSVTGFAQARRIFDFATEELKSMLTNECDMLYECKVCRNIFRSIVNFVSHKRIYCQEKFNSSVHGHFMKTNNAIEISRIKQIEQCYQNSKKVKNITENKEEAEDERIPLTKDLTTVIEKLAKTKGIENILKNPDVTLQKIPSTNVAMFQNVNFTNTEETDMKVQLNELDNILSQDKAVLQKDGKFKIASSKVVADTDNVIQISDDEENDNVNNLKCKICDLQFSTQKTLKFHMKYKHLESRLVYPCPDCFEIFSTSWSVYRHLFKVHRKSAAQIRRLRETIQSKAFRMNNPPAYYEKRKNNVKPSLSQKVTEEERLDQENQAWMDNMEGDSELPRCGGCGRMFERRAALAAHTHTCQPRSRALARRPQENKKIEIQIRKDYNKGPVANLSLNSKNMDEKNVNKGAPLNAKPQKENKTNNEIEETSMAVDEDEEKDITESDKNVSEIVEYKPTINLPHAQQAEKNNFLALKQRMQQEVDLEKLLCKKCDSKCNNSQELYNHMAAHYKWVRYGCKLCTFRHYCFEKLPDHVKIVHRLKGDTDFYYSTVKAIDGLEALELSQPIDESIESNETSPDSRRPSRCSSDSSRLSDDSSSSSTRVEATRKRKSIQTKTNAKRKKDSVVNDDGEDQNDADTSNTIVSNDLSNIKSFEENSSDMDDLDEKVTKKHSNDMCASATYRRPVRKRTKPKNEDFEYDLSNLLKMEAQGYRESQTVTNTKVNQSKKKIQQELISNFENINKDCCGALILLSKKYVKCAAAHLKLTNFNNDTEKDRITSNIFVRPMLPRNISKGDKISPKKDAADEKKELESSNHTKIPKIPDINLSSENLNIECNNIVQNINVVNSDINNDIKTEINDDSKMDQSIPESLPKIIETNVNKISKYGPIESFKKLDKNGSEVESENGKIHVKPISELEPTKPNLSKPTVVPIKLRRQSLEVMKNPIINKNITEFTKAGMKTKILVIKPINRNNKEGSQTPNAPLKFQTIKLKDPSKGSSVEDPTSDQVVVVKVPKVESGLNKPLVENNEKSASNFTNATFSNSIEETSDCNDISGVDIAKSKSAFIDNDITDTHNTSNVETCKDKQIVDKDLSHVDNEMKDKT